MIGKRFRKWLPLLVAACGLGTTLQFANAQTKTQRESPPAKTTNEADVQASLLEQQRQRVFAALRSVADGAREWKDPIAASKAQAQIADLMWDGDPESGRLYLVKAWETAARVADASQTKSQFRNSSQKTTARREVILVARKRANDLAKKWLAQLAEDAAADTSNSNRGVFDDRSPRSTVLLQLALQACDSNPEEAAALATESLNDGVSFGFHEVLLKIQEKDPALAQRVFRSALSRLQTAGLLDPNELLVLYAYLYTPGRTMAANTGADSNHIQLAVGRNLPRVTAAAQLNPALAAEFLNLAADLLIQAPLPSTTASPESAARAQVSVISTLLGMIASVAPDKAAILANRIQALNADAHFSSAPPKLPDGHLETKPGETASQYNERRIDYLEKLAENESTALARDIAFAKAALASTFDSYQRGWDIAGRIEDLSLREGVRNWLTFQVTVNLINASNWNRAYDLLAKNTDHLQRAATLVIGAQKLLTAREKDRAAEWLLEARTLVGKADASANSVRVSLGIVAAYGKIDRVAAFDSLSIAVRVMNKTTAQLTDEDRAPSLKGFSGLDEGLVDLTLGTRGFGLSAALESFDRSQFEDALAIISKLSQAEQRGLATMELCRQYLMSRPKPSAPKSTAQSRSN